MPEQTFTAYMVAALFGNPPTGKILLNAVCAPSPEAAAAMATWCFTKQLDSDEPLNGVNVQPLTPEFMRAALSGKLAEVVPLSVVQRGIDGKPAEVHPLQNRVPENAEGPQCTCSPHWSEADGGFTHAAWCLKAQHSPGGDAA